MKLNPEFLIWDEPQNTVSGDPIPDDRSLEYEVGIIGDGNPEPLMVIPGQLREGTQYEAPISKLDLGDGAHEIALRSFYKDAPDMKSTWSESVSFRIDGSVPESPLGVSVD